MCFLAYFECAHFIIRKGGVGGALGVRLDGILHRDSLCWHVDRAGQHGACLRGSVERITGNTRSVRRAPYLTGRSCLNPDKRIRRPRAWPIAAERNGSAAILKAFPAVRG